MVIRQEMKAGAQKKVRQVFPASPMPTVAKQLEQAPWTQEEIRSISLARFVPSPALLCYHISSCFYRGSRHACMLTLDRRAEHSIRYIYSLENALDLYGSASSDARSSLY